VNAKPVRLAQRCAVSNGGKVRYCQGLSAHWESGGDCGTAHGAQGRDRTTDTAIFSRMLYQLSYLGVPQKPERSEGAAVYSQAIRLCPPCFACLSGAAEKPKPERLRLARPRIKPTAKPVGHGPKGGEGQSRKSMKSVMFPTSSLVAVVLIGTAGYRVGTRQPAIEIDVPAAGRTEGMVFFG
jgi:hypothetical protein